MAVRIQTNYCLCNYDVCRRALLPVGYIGPWMAGVWRTEIAEISG